MSGDTEARKAQKIFASAEYPVREWIADHKGQVIDELFEAGFVGAEPILFDLDKLCKIKGKFLQMKVKVVPHDFKHNLRPEVLVHQTVRDSIQFLAYAVNVVFVTTLKTMEDPPEIQMAWDPKNFIYRPQYMPKVLQEYQMCQYAIDKISKGKPPPGKEDEWAADKVKYSARKDALKPQVDEIEEDVREKNEKLSKSKCISIEARYLKRDQLPPGTFTKHMRPVGAVQYQDPN